MNFDLKNILSKLGEALFVTTNNNGKQNIVTNNTPNNQVKSNAYSVHNDSKYGQNMISPKASLIEMMRKHDDIAKKIKNR